jgi:hypothetical protein
MKKEKLVIGRLDRIDLPVFDLYDVPAKIDTGAYTSSLHCSDIQLIEENGIKYISFFILDNTHPERVDPYTTSDFEIKYIKSSSGHVELRYVIEIKVIIFNKKIRSKFSLTNRGEMKYPILIGRKLLRKRFVVDVTKSNVSYKSKTAKLI